jgi:hypothetical protein
MALKHDCYLHITLALRSMSDEDVESGKKSANIEKMLKEMHSLGNHINLHRYLPCLLRGEHGEVDVDAVLPRGKKTQLMTNMD